MTLRLHWQKIMGLWGCVANSQPYKIGSIVSGIEEHIECSGQGGYPTPNLLAYVGPKSEYSTYEDIPLDRIEETSAINDETREITMISLFKYFPEIGHQNFFVKCISIQSAYENGQVTDIYPIKVWPDSNKLFLFGYFIRMFFTA